MRAAIAVARRSREKGNHPFGAILVDERGEILLEAENTVETEGDCTGHAETNLMRLASKGYDKAFLSRCAVYTSTEPCAMCAGAIYWAGVGRVVFGMREAALFEMTGRDPKNPTLQLPCEEVFARGGQTVSVIGPVLEEEARAIHAGFWNPTSNPNPDREG
ncbi:nucleoside deaminase [Heliobacterium undosum]|uniref:Nucleoside deaminase n=2 Tax=Heliomicrobium undosum TaxID=121734 RepID=A0A845KYZ6_9FIRM|nr:nucleoside deaminase [Heliomicrobium undosum]